MTRLYAQGGTRVDGGARSDLGSIGTDQVLDLKAARIVSATMTADVNFTLSNPVDNASLTLYLDGAFTPTFTLTGDATIYWPAGAIDYDDTADVNIIEVRCIDASVPAYVGVCVPVSEV